MKKNIFHSILFLCFALSILFCQKNNERILSPYNQINGFELDDWTKSPDFGILEFHSNVDNKGIYFDRVEPSEGIDRFIWTYNRVALPYGTYRVKFNSGNKFLKNIDTLIFVERQVWKKINLNVSLKERRYFTQEGLNSVEDFSFIFKTIFYMLGLISLTTEDEEIFDDAGVTAYLSAGGVLFFEIIEEIFRQDHKNYNQLRNKFSKNTSTNKMDGYEQIDNKYNTNITYDIPPKVLRAIKPTYPKLAQEAGVEGTVNVSVFIDKNGRVQETIIQNENSRNKSNGLDEAAIKSIKNASFMPASKNGTPVGVWVNIPINFYLNP